MDSESENRLFGVLLAAGSSRRMGDQNKLLSNVGGGLLIERSLKALLSAGGVIVVTGWQSEAIEAAVGMGDERINFVHNPNYDLGMSSSIKVGLDALPSYATGCFVAPADMPNICADTLALMRDLHRLCPDEIIVPYAGERQGNPVLWPRRFFDALKNLEGDQGAKTLLQTTLSDHIHSVQVDEALLLDIDTMQDLQRFKR